MPFLPDALGAGPGTQGGLCSHSRGHHRELGALASTGAGGTAGAPAEPPPTPTRLGADVLHVGDVGDVGDVGGVGGACVLAAREAGTCGLTSVSRRRGRERADFLTHGKVVQKTRGGGERDNHTPQGAEAPK